MTDPEKGCADSFENLRELAFARMVEKGLQDSRDGRTISNEEMSRRIQSWQK
jgi:predicted transcriptional regulator